MCCLGKVTSTKCTRARTRAVPALRLVVAGVAGDHDDGKGFAHIQEQSGTPSTGRPHECGRLDSTVGRYGALTVVSETLKSE